MLCRYRHCTPCDHRRLTIHVKPKKATFPHAVVSPGLVWRSSATCSSQSRKLPTSECRQPSFIDVAQWLRDSIPTRLNAGPTETEDPEGMEIHSRVCVCHNAIIVHAAISRFYSTLFPTLGEAIKSHRN